MGTVMKFWQLPVVVVLDMDQTMIGDSWHYLSYKEVLQFIEMQCKQDKVQGPICKVRPSQWKKKVLDDFFRPGLKEFVLGMQSMFPKVEFFVYSAAQHAYVLDYLDLVEKHTGVLFNRPVFSRDQCVLDEKRSFAKSLKYQSNTLHEVLGKKYPKHVKDLDTILSYRTLIIDDLSDVWKNDPRVVTCPPYTFSPIFEVDPEIRNHIYHTPSVQQFIRSMEKQMPHVFHVEDANTLSSEELQMRYHLHMVELYNSKMLANKNSRADTFFVDLLKMIRQVRNLKHPFTPKHITTIQSSHV